MKMVVFALTLIRHGETGANKDNIIQGQMDVPLSETGLRQANLLGGRLQNQKYTHIFVSDLVRAQQTVEKIIDKSLFGKCAIVKDPRLRERKFGDVEGKSVGELKKLARRANQSIPSFTPPGAETVQQVRNRAVLFFQELCQQLVQVNGSLSSVDKDQHGCGGSLKRRRQSDGAHEDDASVARHDAVEDEPSRDVRGDAADTDSAFSSLRSGDVPDTKRLSTDSRPAVELRTHTGSALSVNGFKRLPVEQLCVYVPSRRHRKHGENGGGTPDDVRGAIGSPQSSCISFSKHIISPSTYMDIDCPNVSLSPLGHHKFVNMSGALSDRKTSVDSLTDDVDVAACPAANVLVVSHGGFLREMVRHFVEDLGCSVPGGKGQALRISPNTGLSKFTISIAEHTENPKVICLLIHDKDHLVGNGFATEGSTTTTTTTAL